MEFVHRPYRADETIAAIATPPGEGGVAIIRISGKEAVEVAAKVFSGPVRQYKTHTAHVGQILGREKEIIDEVLLLPMLAPKSYTGEDVIEIHCHGGHLISQKVLQEVLCAGARAARPGEFTFKAYMNGKLDLAQAEAVQELIAARNELALNAASDQLSGALSQAISSFQRELTDVAAILEAWVDFPEEGLEFASLEEILTSLAAVRKRMQNLHDSFHKGAMLHTGVSLCLAGAPNVGKSSLMNALLGKDRAIVTEIAGTTRDILEADMRLGGLHVRLIDTAGMRETEEKIEKEGIRRSKEAMGRADLVLLVLDASQILSEEEKRWIEASRKERTILVWNKIDLPHTPQHIEGVEAVRVSAKEAWKLDDLHAMIDHVIWKRGAPVKEEIVITNMRHAESLSQALKALDALIEGLKTGVSAEFLSSDMRTVLEALGSIIGVNITEDILSAIFSKFCVGK
jgi:tRNA modification GTPase